MNEKRYGKKKCIAIKSRRSPIVKMLFAVLTMMLIGAMFANPVLGQNPCNEIGPGCRVLTTAEVKAFKELVLAVKVLLPVPDVARYSPDGAIEASTMPFVALTKIPGAVSTGVSWQTGCFPDSPYV